MLFSLDCYYEMHVLQLVCFIKSPAILIIAALLFLHTIIIKYFRIFNYNGFYNLYVIIFYIICKKLNYNTKKNKNVIVLSKYKDIYNYLFIVILCIHICAYISLSALK